MKVTPFTRDLLKAYREDREQARQISASFREKAEADAKSQAKKVVETVN